MFLINNGADDRNVVTFNRPMLHNLGPPLALGILFFERWEWYARKYVTPWYNVFGEPVCDGSRDRPSDSLGPFVYGVWIFYVTYSHIGMCPCHLCPFVV